MFSITLSFPPFGGSQRPQCGFNHQSSSTGKKNQFISSYFCTKSSIEVQKDIGDTIIKLPTALQNFATWQIVTLILALSRSSSPCSTQRTAASKVTRGALISSRCSQQDWEAAWRAGFIAHGNQAEGGECSCGSFPHQSPQTGLAPWGKTFSATHFSLFQSCEAWEVWICPLLLWVFFPFLPSRAAALMEAEPGGTGRLS